MHLIKADEPATRCFGQKGARSTAIRTVDADVDRLGDRVSCSVGGSARVLSGVLLLDVTKYEYRSINGVRVILATTSAIFTSRGATEVIHAVMQ